MIFHGCICWYKFQNQFILIQLIINQNVKIHQMISLKTFSSLQLQNVKFSLLKQCFNRDDRVSYIILIMYGIVYSNYQSKLFLASREQYPLIALSRGTFHIVIRLSFNHQNFSIVSTFQNSKRKGKRISRATLTSEFPEFQISYAHGEEHLLEYS
jgi:hypothetical protein